MSEIKHTPGPWSIYFNSQDDLVIRKMFPSGDESHVVARCNSGMANALRIVACVNACEGISTENLESVVYLGETLSSRFSLFKTEIDSLQSELNIATKQRDELQEEVNALKERAEYDLAEFARTLDTSYAEIKLLQKQRDQLLAAVRSAAEQIRRCDYTPARSTLLQAIAAVEQPAHSLSGRGAEIKVASCPNCFTVFPIDDEGDVEQHDLDGWIAWKGGECPVDGAARVEVKYADGYPGQETAGNLRWSWIFAGEKGGDIIAYRVVQGGGAK